MPTPEGLAELLRLRAAWLAIPLACVLVLACRGGSQAPPIRQLAPGEEAPNCVLRPDGSIIITAGETLCFEPEQVAVGETVRVTATKWEDGSPVEFYLLTEQQADLWGRALFDVDLVRLGEVDLEGGEVSFAFTLAGSFETLDGNTLEVQSGDRLFLMGHQHTNGTSGAHAAGPLVVR